MPQMEFEPTISVFEQVKMVHALDHVATVIGFICAQTTFITNAVSWIITKCTSSYPRRAWHSI
jgi:hypothetical protein